MSRFSKLKNAEDRFKQISLTDDYTVEERQEVRNSLEEAKEKNKNESGNFIWKERDSPKRNALGKICQAVTYECIERLT